MAADQLNIVVVDAQPGAWAAIRSSNPSARLTMVESGVASLKIALSEPVDAWFIGVRLPDMTGFELHDLLRRRYAGSCFVLVGDNYQAEDELQARAAGASYLSKPPKSWWLEKPQTSITATTPQERYQ